MTLGIRLGKAEAFLPRHRTLLTGRWKRQEGVIKMSNFRYPDSGSPFEDASILRNAVYFSTAQRAYSAQLILQQPLNVGQQTLDFLVVKAFEEFMTSTEDLIAWLFALQEWQPGNAEFSLFILLDRIMVGRGNYTEERAVSILSSLNVDSFRELFHIPKDGELTASGVSKELVDNIGRSMQFKLEGWLRIARRRAEQGRGWVHMFNKCKHHMYAFPTRARNKDEVWMPTSIRLDKAQNRVLLGQGWLEASTEELRRLAGDAIGAQVILHDTLALILTTRYDKKYEPPQWVIRAYQTDYLWSD